MISNLSGFFCNKKYFSCSFHFFFAGVFFIATWEKEKDVRWEWRVWDSRLAGFMCRGDFCECECENCWQAV